MQAIWSQLVRWAETEIDGQLDLRPGCREDELAVFELELGVRLPEDVRRFYLIHDGQERGADFGLIYGLPLLSIAEIVDRWRKLAVDAELADDHSNQRCLSGERIRPLYAHRGWIPFTHDWGGNYLGIDLAPGRTGLVGQIINFGRDEQDKYVLADSFTAMWGWLLEHYLSGNIEIERNDAGVLSARPKDPPAPHAFDAFPLMLGVK